MIALHLVDLLAVGEVSLGDDELARAGRYRVERARRAFVACRSALRLVLAAHLGVAPGELEVSAREHSRPSVVGARVSFSVSHSGDVGLIAVVDGERRLGVDVEAVRASSDFEAVAKDYFHPTEIAVIGNRRDAFFRCWTKKEAVVKSLGEGLTHTSRNFVVDVDRAGPAAVEGVDGLAVAGLVVDDGYVGAIAADGKLEYAWMT